MKHETGYVIGRKKIVDGNDRGYRYVSYNWAEGGEWTKYIDSAKLWKRRINAEKFMNERPEMRGLGWEIIEVSYLARPRRLNSVKDTT